MDLRDDDLEQIAGADRRAIDPPIQVDTDATPTKSRSQQLRNVVTIAVQCDPFIRKC